MRQTFLLCEEITFQNFICVMFVEVNTVVIIKCAVVVRHTVFCDINLGVSVALLDKVQQVPEAPWHHVQPTGSGAGKKETLLEQGKILSHLLSFYAYPGLLLTSYR